jgi:surface antigen
MTSMIAKAAPSPRQRGAHDGNPARPHLSRLPHQALVFTVAVLGIALLVGSGPAYGAKGVEIIQAGTHPDQNDIAVTVVMATTPHTTCGGSARVEIRGSAVSRKLPAITTSAKGDGLWEWRIDGKIPPARWKVSVDCRLVKQARKISSDSREFSAPAGHGPGSESGIFVPGSLRGRAVTLKGRSGGEGGGGAILYPHGECTWYVATRRPDLPYFPGASGNALNWLNSARKDGFKTGTTPLAGSVAVFQPGQYGALKYGHVAYVEEVLPNQLIKISEFNYRHHLAKDERTISSKALHFIYESDTSHGEGGSTIPVNTAQPTITGVPKVGRELTCTVGSWSGGPSIAYLAQWYRDGAAVALATAPTYLVQPGDEGHVLGCVVTASTEAGSTKAPATSVIIYSLPNNTVPPFIEGTPIAGTTLTCALGLWAGTPAENYRYQWLLGETRSVAAAAPEFTPTRADEGEPLSCRVTAENPAGEATAESRTIDIYQEPINTALPQITGGVSGTEANVGELLSCGDGTWKGLPAPSYSRQWLRGPEAIAGATGGKYVVQAVDEGRLLACEVEATNAAGKTSATSAAVRVSSVPTNTSPPRILGSGKVGSALTCSAGEWEAVPVATFTYRWHRDNALIEGANEEKYQVQTGDEGHLLTCIVTAENVAGKVSIESQNGISVAEEARKAKEEEERKEKEIIVSIDNTKGDRGPYDGIFERAWQKFTADSDRITYAGVTIGNPNLPVGNTASTLELRLCSTQECTGSGSELGHAQAAIDNYGVSAGEFEPEVDVVPGHIYYLVWATPPKVAGAGWLTFWHAGSPVDIELSEALEAVIRGYDSEGAHSSNREIISYGGVKPPPAPYSAPFNFAYQNFVAASNRITRLGVVLGNTAAAVHKPAVPQEVELLICTSRTCESPALGRGRGSLVNYGVTEVELEAPAHVVVGREYYVYWNSPTAYEATPWVTFWRGSGPKPEDAEQLQVAVRGYDAGSETFHPTFFPETAEITSTTFSSYENASGPGPEISASQTVQVSCKVFAPEIASIEPEGYWYRIHTSPWKDEFYAAANAFENNTEGKKTIDTDFKVPDC